MSNSALTSNQYNTLKKKINSKYGGNKVIMTEDIIQESYLKLLENGHDLADPRYVMNTAKYVTLNAVAVSNNHKRLEPDYTYFNYISNPSRSLDMPDLHAEYKGILISNASSIIEAISIPDKSRSVLCVTTGEVFTTSLKAAKAYNISTGMISKHLAGKKKSAGKLKGLALQWKRLTKDN